VSVERIPIQGATFSSAVAASGKGRTIYLSGKVAEGRDLRTQAELIFDQISNDLIHFGGSLADVVRVTAYLTSLEDYSEYSRVRGERLGDNPPASTAVQVAGLLHGALIEIDAVAFLSN
jgi:2-iminobutanoate/2-iminopropanoate deaminase